MPDDHSKLAPLLPIPNRTVKRLSADDSADSRVKVGHRQALTASNRPTDICQLGVLLSTFLFGFNWLANICQPQFQCDSLVVFVGLRL